MHYYHHHDIWVIDIAKCWYKFSIITWSHRTISHHQICVSAFSSRSLACKIVKYVYSTDMIFFCSFRIEHHLFGLELNSRLKIRRKFVSMTDDISPMWVLNSIIRLFSWTTSKVELMTEVLIIANQTSRTGNYKEIIYTFLIMYIHL